MALSAAVKAKRVAGYAEKIAAAEDRIVKLEEKLAAARLVPDHLRSELEYLEQAPVRLEDQTSTPEGFATASVPGFNG
jgi:transcription elongation GreA/GreB family factor